MTLKHFIERPVLASVISIVIVIAGLIGLATLPVEQYPDIAPPTVMVRASYPGLILISKKQDNILILSIYGL